MRGDVPPLAISQYHVHNDGLSSMLEVLHD